jgi:hypothetical protein
MSHSKEFENWPQLESDGDGTSDALLLEGNLMFKSARDVAPVLRPSRLDKAKDLYF